MALILRILCSLVNLASHVTVMPMLRLNRVEGTLHRAIEVPSLVLISYNPSSYITRQKVRCSSSFSLSSDQKTGIAFVRGIYVFRAIPIQV